MGMMSRLIPVVAMAAAVAGASPSLGAQKAERTSGPEKGTWGAEVSLGNNEGASVLRFQSPRWALLASGTASSLRVKDDITGRTSSFNSVALRVGARRYARSGLGLRPVTGFGATYLNNTNTLGSSDSGQYGVYGELGASWFFTPHLALGAVGDAVITHATRRTSTYLNVVRLTASVFF
jgi:hypothetical protein